MPRIVFFITFFGLFSLGLTQNIAKAEDSAYFVQNVQVDVLDSSAVAARNKAFAEAQKKAFLMLASRFVEPEALKTLTPPEDRLLSGLIQDFEISSEQLSTKRYRGVFDFRFKATAVNRYFGRAPSQDNGQTNAEDLKILILPYYQEGQNTIVFDKSKNPYWISLLQEFQNDETIVLPEGSISDVTDIGNSNPDSLSAATIRRFMARYEVDNVVVALAHVDLQHPETVRIDIYKTKNGSIGPTTSFDITPNQVAIETVKAAKGEAVNGVQVQKKEAPISTNVNVVNTNLPKSVTPAIPVPTPTLAPVIADSKPVASGSVRAKVFFNNMSEWIAMQKILLSAPGVTHVRMTSLKANQVDMVLEYKDWNQITTALPALGLNLMAQSDGTYVIKR